MARGANSIDNRALLEAALEGLEAQRVRLDEQIAEVKRMLGRQGRSRTNASAEELPAVNATGERSRKRLSAAARKRIAAAQKRRWAEYRKDSAKVKKQPKVAEAAAGQ